MQTRRAVVSKLANALNTYLDFRRYEQQVEAVYSYSRNALSCSHFAMVYYSDELSRACPSIPASVPTRLVTYRTLATYRKVYTPLPVVGHYELDSEDWMR